MTDEQLRQIILDAYDARKETKEYFEFFLNPDVDKLLNVLSTKLEKEFRRTKWGRCKARTTVVKQAVNNVISLNPEPVTVINALFRALTQLALADSCVEINDTQRKLGVWLMDKVVKTADDAQIFSEIAPRIYDFLHNPPFRPSFMKYISDNINLQP